MKIFTNGNIIMEDRVLKGYNVAIDGSKIVDIYKDKVKSYSGEVIDAKGNFISPGFIDIHVHGGGEGDFLDGDVQEIKDILNIHTFHGTTGIYPTTLACEDEEVYSALEIINSFMNRSEAGAEVLGVHLEGPYLAMTQRGAQDPKYIKYPVPDEYMSMFESNDIIKRVTYAPELPYGMAFTDYLVSKGILPSIGHSDAEYKEVLEAYNHGATHVTHLYSGMQGVHRVSAYRKLGVVESSYLIDGMTVEIIADGKHLPIELLQLIYKIKGADKIALITDAMRAAGRLEGESILGSKKKGQRVILKDGVAFMPDFEAFAGSIATMDRLIRNMYNKVDVEIYNAVKMASLTPARIMGCDDRKGSIEIGKDADIVIFNTDIDILYVMTRGETFLNKLPL